MSLRDDYEVTSLALANKCREAADGLASECVSDVVDAKVAVFMMFMEAMSQEPAYLSKFMNCLATGILVEMERDTNMGN